MTASKKLGIWVDHSSAHIIEFSSEDIESKIISSKSTHQDKVHGSVKSEKLMHIKEQHLQQEYYRKLGDVIKNYEEVVLFGPTEAKVELFNILKADHLFEKINIEIKLTDKMTENQKHAFVREYFLNTI